MMKYSFSLLLLITMACAQLDDKGQVIPIDYHGALKNIMKKGDLSSKFSLDSISDRSHLYALGAIENLKGEIQIFDGQAYHTSVLGDSIVFNDSYAVNATLFVSATVENWVSFDIPSNVLSKKELEQYIEETAQSNNINVSEPFPFMIEGAPKLLDWHIINWPEGDTEHSHEKHVKSGLYGQLTDRKVKMIGFYSDSHHAVFTHHTTNMHIHMKTEDGTLAGHVDDLKVGPNMTLKIPAITEESNIENI